MNTCSATTEEIMGFICDELQRDQCAAVSSNATLIRLHCTQASFIMESGERPCSLVFWMSCHWSYTCVTGKKTLAAIEETARDYCESILGTYRPVHVVVGRVNSYVRRRKP